LKMTQIRVRNWRSHQFLRRPWGEGCSFALEQLRLAEKVVTSTEVKNYNSQRTGFG
jgi:hypothetical protein